MASRRGSLVSRSSGGRGSCCKSFRLGFGVLRGDFLHNRGGALFADLAGRIVDAAMRMSELAAGCAGLRIEFVECCSALFGSKPFRVDARKHGGAVRVLQKDFTSVVEGFNACGDRHIEKSTHFGLVKRGIKQADVLLDYTSFRVDDEDRRQRADATISHNNLRSGEGNGIVD